MCSRMLVANETLPRVVVAGGKSELGRINSTEILDLGTSVWSEGIDLPDSIYDGVMLEHPSRGVMAVGGELNWFFIYYLPWPIELWIQLPQTLPVPRSKLTDFLVSDSFVDCT